MATAEASLPLTDDPTGARPGSPPSVAGLVSGIIGDAQTLLRQQAEMLKSEVREDFKRSKRAAEFGAIAIVCTTVGALGLITAVAYLLHEQFQFKMWASWGMVSLAFLGVGGALGWFSYVLLERFNPLPDKTFNALKENVTWQTK
ncbi:MAG TPA: phage holin family protein [Gemmata sp.]